MIDPQDLDALIFDTGGTVFDWHTAVRSSLESVGSTRGLDADWGAVTKTWRRRSTTMVDVAMPTAHGVATIDMDDVLRLTLAETLNEHSIHGFSAEDEATLVAGWRGMPAWIDVPTGLPRLRDRFVVAPFTILKAALVIEASRRSNITWDAVISCEMIGVYKTRRPAYESAARWLDLPIERIMLVTTHNNDLEAAHGYGFATAFVERPHEWSDIPSPDPDASPLADLVAHDFEHLADELGLD
jgi:2-haloacid dehalogenase